MDSIVINNFHIEVKKKDIKNIHLSVLPPNGKIKISAPLSVTDEALHAFASSRLSWIKEQLKKIDKQERESRREYVSGESFYLLGKRYLLNVIVGSQRDITIKSDRIILQTIEGDSEKQKSSFVDKWYRKRLKEVLEELIEKWSEKLNLRPTTWQIRNMKTKWGSCNSEKSNLLFALQLVKKPIDCIEYVVLHEICHLRHKKHNTDFLKILDDNMPNWRGRKDMLNSFILDYIEEI